MEKQTLEAFKFVIEKAVYLWEKEKGSKNGLINFFGGIFTVLFMLGFAIFNEFKRLIFWLLSSIFTDFTSPPTWQTILVLSIIPIYFLVCVYFVHDKIPD